MTAKPETTDWRPIEDAPDDFDRPGGPRFWRLRDGRGVEYVGRQATFNNSGWLERGTNREIWPVQFAALEPAT
jgi:hypothetical protein